MPCACAVRLFPRNEEQQDKAVTEFWGFLLAGEREGSLPILARYDGQRPLVPWLIRVFQNKHLSDLRQRQRHSALPDDDLDERDLPLPTRRRRPLARGVPPGGPRLARGPAGQRSADPRPAPALSPQPARGRQLLGIHEGNVSRQTTKLRDHCLEHIGQRLHELGWTGDDLSDFILKEMDSLLLDEPRLSADRLAALLAQEGQETADPVKIAQLIRSLRQGSLSLNPGDSSPCA